MRLATVRDGHRNRPAVLLDDSAVALHDVAATAGIELRIPDDGGAGTIVTALAAGDESVRVALDAATQGAEVPRYTLTALGPPLPSPGKIICVGRNYAEHAKESGGEVPSQPLLFAKLTNTIVGPFDDVIRPLEVDDLDYEAELCVVIGRRSRRLQREHALDAVAGYCCANDISARTLQYNSGGQWLRGKSHDTFCPIGPAVLTADEVPNPQQLTIESRVDGEVRQHDTTASMVFDVATLIAYVSTVVTLEPGDLILTGTPPGVAMGMSPPRWLQPGQLCEVEIERIGTLANRIVAEAAPTARP